MATPAPDPDAMMDGGEHEVELNRPVDLATVEGEIIEVDLDDLVNDEGENVGLQMLRTDNYTSRSWMVVASELLRQGRTEMAETTLYESLAAFNKRSDANGMAEAYALLGHISLLQSKSAPKVVLKDAKYDKRTETRTKQDHWRAAHEHFSRAEQHAARADAGKDRSVRRLPILIGRILLNLASFNFDEAERGVAQALRVQPNNLIVLMCQGRLGNAQRNPAIALKSYQKILSLDPEFSPDPRVGLGLAFWQSGDIKKAKLAWRRAIERDPACYGAKLLLATADGNDARDYNLALSSDKRQDLAIAALGNLNQLFKATKGMSAPAALSMVRPTEVKGQITQAIKLVERAIQFSDTMGHTRRAISERTRLAFVEGDMRDVTTYAERAKTDKIPDVTVNIIRAQVAIQQGAQREALAIMEDLYKKIGPTAPVEVAWLYALLLAYPYPGLSNEQRTSWTREARDLLDRLHGQVKSARSAGPAALARLRGLGEDADTFVLLAGLWQADNVEKAIGAYQTAISLHTVQLAGAEQPEDARDIKGWKLSNNLATLYHLQGNVDSAMQLYEEVVAAIAEPRGSEEEMLQSTLLYNLGRAYEDSQDFQRATEAYQGLLSRHPEYINAKMRLAQIAYTSGRLPEADALLKEANLGNATEPQLRAYVAHHLYRQGMWDDLSKFAQSSRKLAEDAHTWCVLGAYHYHQARESRKGDHADRLKEFCRSAEAYNQALAADPACAVAAQGLAIAIAEDSLATKQSEVLGGEESSKGARIRNAEAALAIFSRVKDSLLDVSVQVNSGHCYFVKGDEERAIEAYGSASLQASHQDPQILLYLARAHYQLATRKSNFSAMIKGLSFCQRALRLKPADRTILYNIAMIEQKAAELLFSLSPADRTLNELQRAISLAEHSVIVFRTLAEVTDRPLPYDPDLTEQRSRYGESVLKRAGDQKQRQEEYESSQTAKDLAAKKRRAEERARIEEMEQARLREAQQRAAEEAEILRVQKEQARAWAQEMRQAEEDEEMRRQELQRARQERKEREANWSGGEGGGGGGGERKPKRKSKKKKAQEEDEEMPLDGDGLAIDEEEGEMTGEEGDVPSRSRSRTPRAPKPKKKRPAAVDPDGEDDAGANRPLKKNKVKSVAVLGDTDSE